MTLTINESNSTVGVVTLDQQVYGGPQAVEFADILREFVEGGGKHCVVDLQAVTVMNSSGIGMLVSGMTTMQKNGGEFVIAGVPEKVRVLLEMTRLTTVLKSADTVEDAIAMAG